jgi:hypothetical protein
LLSVEAKNGKAGIFCIRPSDVLIFNTNFDKSDISVKIYFLIDEMPADFIRGVESFEVFNAEFY